MPSAAQYQQPTIRRSPTLLVREITPASAAGTYTVFNLPKDAVVLDGGIGVRTAGTGAGTWKLQHSEGTVDLTATVANNVLNALALLTKTNMTTCGKRAAAAASVTVVGAGTLTVSGTLLCWIIAYREDYGS